MLTIMYESEIINRFERLLKESVNDLIKDKEVSVAFSGGIDSSVLAKIIKIIGYNPVAYVVGTENSKDFESAEKAAKEIEISLNKILVDNKEIEEAIKILKSILNNVYEKHKKEEPILKPNPVSISFYLPLFFAAKYSKEKYIITGQGADELLGGYDRYSKLKERDAIKEMNKDARLLIKFGKLRDIAICKHFGKELLMPYLDKKIVDFCISLPFELKINKKIRKCILRKLGEKIGLSKNIYSKEKKAAQYGSGIMKAMKQIAKSKNQRLNQYVTNI